MNRSVHFIQFVMLIGYSCITGAQESASPVFSSTASISPASASEKHSLTIEVDGYRIMLEDLPAEQAAGLKQWRRMNTLIYWAFIGLTPAGLMALGIVFYREKQRQKNRVRLLSKDPQDLAAGIQGLSGRPREAYPLLLLWIQEYRNHRKILDGGALLMQTDLQVMKTIQEALESMAARKSYRIEWRPLSLPWPRSISYPRIQIVRGARLEEKTITVDIGPIHLKGAYMENGCFSKIGLKHADLSEANLREADFTSARMEDVLLDKACLIDADFSKGEIKTVSFTGACLRDSRFIKGNLQEVDFTGACLEGADFQEAKLIGVVFVDSNLAGAKFLDVNLEWCIL
ncbi:MAG: pentapeptide repeat-containing protein, partial [Candidatus Hinthialibacter sp.]